MIKTIPESLKVDFLLFITALIWGSAFVAQRAGMDHMGPYIFNAVRFALGAITLVPLIYYRQKNGLLDHPFQGKESFLPLIKAGIIAGTLLFLGSGLQQVGIVYTTVGKAGFITGLAVVLVPIFGLIRKEAQGKGVWISALLAVTGLYFLSVNPNQNFKIEFGDFLIFLCAIAFALHILAIGWLVTKIDCVILAATQFFVNSILSFGMAFVLEDITLKSIIDGAIPILYGGLGSVGIAYTLQIVAQRKARPTHAAIILSLESVFAVLAGWLILNEAMGSREIWGCAFMLAGMLVAQLGAVKDEG
jgi:drug/metabolite transporter (DMT)-like permease